MESGFARKNRVMAMHATPLHPFGATDGVSPARRGEVGWAPPARPTKGCGRGSIAETGRICHDDNGHILPFCIVLWPWGLGVWRILKGVNIK